MKGTKDIIANFISLTTESFMQYSTLALSGFIILFGVYTLIMTFKAPLKQIRLKFMRDKLGVKAGTLLHTVIYAIVPVIFGCFMLDAGLNGMSITQFITGNQ